jgi:hypothetical protein
MEQITIKERVNVTVSINEAKSFILFEGFSKEVLEKITEMTLGDTYVEVMNKSKLVIVPLLSSSKDKQ